MNPSNRQQRWAAPTIAARRIFIVVLLLPLIGACGLKLTNRWRNPYGPGPVDVLLCSAKPVNASSESFTAFLVNRTPVAATQVTVGFVPLDDEGAIIGGTGFIAFGVRLLPRQKKSYTFVGRNMFRSPSLSSFPPHISCFTKQILYEDGKLWARPPLPSYP